MGREREQEVGTTPKLQEIQELPEPRFAGKKTPLIKRVEQAFGDTPVEIVVPSLYFDPGNELSTMEIAELLEEATDIKVSVNTPKVWLAKSGFSGRTGKEAFRLRRTRLEREIQDAFAGVSAKIILPSLYYDPGNPLSIRRVSELLEEVADVKVSTHTVRRMLKEQGFVLRTRSEEIRLQWKNPQLRAKFLRGRRTPLARKNRTEAARKAWQDEVKRANMLAGVKKGVENRFRKTRKRAERELERLVPQGKTARERLLLLIAETGSKTAAAAELEVSDGTINEILAAEGIDYKRPSKPKLNPENIELVELAKKHDLLVELIDSQREVLRLRYEGKPLTLSQIGEKRGLAKANIHLIEKRALGNLGKKLSEKGLLPEI